MNSSNQTNQRVMKSNQNIQVYVRVRPTNTREKLIKSLEMVEVHPTKEIVVKHALDTKMTKKFTFDKVFGQESRQADVYSSVVGPLIEEVLAGYNCTVFAYGQTGTGKTYTMVGEEEPILRSSWDDDSMIGIIPRALNHLFDELRMMDVEYSMRISYLELYNEELCDLLSSSDDFTKIRIYDDSSKKGSVIIQGLEEIPVHNINDVFKLLAKGQERRKTAATLMNAQSSRSHTVFSILVHIKENGIDGEEMLKTGKLNLVDLAGSENISKSGNEKGIRTRETVNINQSLLTLGRVITALVERAPHIPYRESKLTRLLQESLGGRTKTSIIATISPGHKDIEETLSTLEYAHRAKNIQNKPEINQRLTKRTVLKEYTEEIDKLKRDLMAAREKNGIFLAEDTYNDMIYKLENQNKEINDKVMLIKAIKEDLTNKQKLFSEVSLNLIDKTEELIKKEKILSLTKTELDYTQKNLTHAKRRCEEKTYLLDKHIKTEEVLTKQATDLISVAELASSDTYSLHNTITRRKDVDHKLKSSCEQFSNKLTKTLNDMDTNLANLKTKYVYQSNLILADLESNTKMNKQLNKSLDKQLKSLVTVNNDSINNIYNCIDNYTNRTNSWSDEYKNVINEMFGNMGTMLNGITEEFNNQITTIQEACKTQKSNFEIQYEKLVQKRNENTDMIDDFCVKQATNLQTITSEVTNVFNENYNLINTTLTKNLNVNREQEKNINTMEVEFQKLIKSMRAQITATNENTEIISNATLNLNNNSIKLNENIGEHIKSISEHNDAVKTNFANIGSIITDLNEENSKHFVTNTEYINALKCKENENTGALTSNIDEVKNKIDEEFVHLKDNVVSVNNSAKSIQQENIFKVDAEYNKLSENLELEINNLNQRNTQTIAFQNLLQESISHYESDCHSTIQLSKNHLEKFVSEEMVVYVPTGETPMKTQFSFTKSLASTSPHESLIKRFRLDRNMVENVSMNSVTEDEESTLSIDENFINSTPVKMDAGITERKKSGNILKVPTLGNMDNIQDNNNADLIDTKKTSQCITNSDTIECQDNLGNIQVG